MRRSCGWTRSGTVLNVLGYEVDYDDTCEFEGDVEVETVDDGTFYWDCPVCGHEHHVDPAPDPEPEPADEDGWLEAAYEDANGGEVDVE